MNYKSKNNESIPLILVIIVGGNISLWAGKDRYDQWTIRTATNQEIGSYILDGNDKLHIRENDVAGRYIKVEFDNFIKLEGQSREQRDSSVIRPELWKSLAELIRKSRSKYDGFVVLHGLDTMAYTASALSFLLTNVDVPIVFTGSQLPLNYIRTDALQNIICSIILAASKTENEKPVPMIPEVCIFCHDTLYRANRTSMSDPSSYHTFHSKNYRPLAHVKEYIDIKTHLTLKISQSRMGRKQHVDAVVNILDVYPGIDENVIANLKQSNPDMKGIILRTYGMGTAPISEKFLNAIELLANDDVVIMAVTQAPTGHLALPNDPVSLRLYEHGVIYGSDLTVEAAFTKMKILLSEISIKKKDNIKKSIAPVQDVLQLSICGEQSRSLIILRYTDGLETKISMGECKAILTPDKEPHFWHMLENEKLLQIQLRILGIEPVILEKRVTRSINFDVDVVERDDTPDKVDCNLLKETLRWEINLLLDNLNTPKNQNKKSKTSKKRSTGSSKSKAISIETFDEYHGLSTKNLVADVTRHRKYLLNPKTTLKINSDDPVKWKKLELVFCIDSVVLETRYV